MNISKLISARFGIAVLCLVLAVAVAAPKVYAQDDDGDGGCDCDSGFVTDSATPSYSPDYDTGYVTDDATPSYSPDYDSGYVTDDATPSYSPDYDSGYVTDSATPSYSDVDYSDEPEYSSDASYSTPTYDVTNPIYTTGGIGYSSGVYTTPSIGYSTPVITPTPSTHTVTPTPVVYNTPTQTQPIVINNTNTNTNTNVNTAPVAQATPQTIVVYSQPVVPTYVPPVETYVPPTAPSPYVSLTQIPYTGFDFGPIGDTIYWIGLALFAMAAAYLLVYYRGGAFALAGEMIKNRRSQTNTTTNHTVAHVKTPKAEVHAEAPVVNTPVAVVAPIARALPGTDMRRTTADSMIVAHSKNGEIPRIVISRA